MSASRNKECRNGAIAAAEALMGNIKYIVNLIELSYSFLTANKWCMNIDAVYIVLISNKRVSSIEAELINSQHCKSARDT